MKNYNIRSIVLSMSLFVLLICPYIMSGNANAAEEIPYVESSHWSLMDAEETAFFERGLRYHSVFKSGIATDSAGQIYVSLPSIFKIKRYSPVGEVNGTWRDGSADPYSGLIAIGSDGIYNASGFNVERFGFDGTTSRFRTEELISALCIDNEGNILLTDGWNWDIFKYNSSGVLLERFRLVPPPVTPPVPRYAHYKHLVAGRDGLIYVLNENTDQETEHSLHIIIYDPVTTGRSAIDLRAAEFGCQLLPGEYGPRVHDWWSNMALDENGHIYVYCPGPTRSIIKVRNDGYYIAKYTSVPNVTDMAIYEGNLYIVDGHNNVYKSALRTDPAMPRPVCGNRALEAAEECDDGNTRNGDGCSSTCRIERCGDGIVQSPREQCDDGNTVSGDGCNSTCQREGGAPPTPTLPGIKKPIQPAVKVPLPARTPSKAPESIKKTK